MYYFLLALMLAFMPLTLRADNNSAPPQARAAGYTQNTLSSSFTQDIDLNDSRASGFHWYTGKWFGWPSTQARSLSVKDNEGVTLTDGGSTANYTIGSATETSKKLPQHWVGTAYGGGGYFEAVIKFDTAAVMTPRAVGFPAWWLEPVEHLADPRTDQWPGQQSGYEHFTEVDVFEYNQWATHAPSIYSGAVHDWSGVYAKTCKPQFCHAANTGDHSRYNNYLIEVAKNTDFGKLHKFGLLWVPATDNTQGYLQYYFDDVATGTHIKWDKYKGASPKTGDTPWKFGVLDQQHMVLILGTGNNQPMTVQSVDVWQATATKNLTH